MIHCARALIVVLVLIWCACSRREQPRQFQLRGTVVRLDPTTNLASIQGEKIGGWMEAMTMEYPVRSAEEYKALRKGEKITATVNLTNEGYWLSNVKERKDD